jgi:leader peptidase (prepilin peptidase) / N-methyltransferase
VSQLAGAVGLGIGLVASPYLAALTVRVPDRSDDRWWTWRRVTMARIALTASVAAVVGLLAALAAKPPAAVPAFVVLALVATPLIVIDVEHHRLPDRLVGAGLIGAAMLLTLAAAVDSHWGALLRAAEAAVASFLLLFVVALASPRSLGFGDVKLAALLGCYLGWLGWDRVLPGFLLALLVGACLALVALASRRASLSTHLPFGPSLVFGMLITATAYASV